MLISRQPPIDSFTTILVRKVYSGEFRFLMFADKDFDIECFLFYVSFFFFFFFFWGGGGGVSQNNST